MLQYVMNFNTISFKRRNILGELYKHCDTLTSIPIYINDVSEEPVGTVEESLEHCADAFLFHLPENICKRLSTNGFDINFDYDFTSVTKVSRNDRIKLNYIILADKQESLPIPRRKLNKKVENFGKSN